MWRPRPSPARLILVIMSPICLIPSTCSVRYSASKKSQRWASPLLSLALWRSRRLWLTWKESFILNKNAERNSQSSLIQEQPPLPPKVFPTPCCLAWQCLGRHIFPHAWLGTPSASCRAHVLRQKPFGSILQSHGEPGHHGCSRMPAILGLVFVMSTNITQAKYGPIMRSSAVNIAFFAF